MIILLGTTDKLQMRLNESANSELICKVTWLELAESGWSYKTNTVLTNGANVVDLIVPPSGAVISVESINIANSDNIDHTVFVGEDNNGSVSLLRRGYLKPYGYLDYEVGLGWAINPPTEISLGTIYGNNRYVLTGAKYETIDRNLCDEVNTAVLSSGRLSLQAIYIPAGTLINSISFWSATTAGATLTNQLFGLYDNNRNLLATSVNNTNTAWAANSRKTLALTAPFTTTYSGLYYLAIMVTAGTVPTLKGNTAKTGGQLNAGEPSMGGTSNTGLTTALPATANAPGTVTTSVWGCVS
jgi:hypothetical protein